MESLVRKCRRASRGADQQEARHPREEPYLDMCTDDDGTVVIRGRLPQESLGRLDGWGAKTIPRMSKERGKGRGFQTGSKVLLS
jgi:hypothetical protein